MPRKRTFIKVRSGLLEPKHRRKMGNAIFLYLYILDRANWEDGVISEWSDEAVAEELEMPVSTVRYQRRHLEDELYIQSRQHYHRMEISITKWSNPKERNTPAQEEAEPEDDGDNPLPPSDDGGKHGGNHGGKHGGNHGIKILTPIHIDSEYQNIRISELREADAIAPPPAGQSQEITDYITITGHKPKDKHHAALITAGMKYIQRSDRVDYLQPVYDEWVSRGYNPYNLAWLTEWGVDGIPVRKVIKTDDYEKRAAYWEAVRIPGSPEAISAGCTCNGDYHTGCPLHGEEEEELVDIEIGEEA